MSRAAPAADDRHRIVGTTAGAVRGMQRDGSIAFLGIPFAEPPVGDLRFAAPVPHRAWTGVRDALEHGPTPQRGDHGITLIPEPSVAGESTLNVDVFTPTVDAASALPVLVYIHGGGFVSGSPASPWYDGAAFARDGVVTVTVSYRLGFEGFGWIEGAPANRGVLDWLLALEWVRANIASFGGDPSRVTIAGQSAGGGAVLTLLGMPAAQHLFAGVYCMSGAIADIPRERAEQFAARLAAAAGVEPTLAGFSSLSQDRLSELQQSVTRPADDGRVDVKATLDDPIRLGPVVDGTVLTRPTIDSIRDGVGADRALVLGATDDEFSMAFATAKRRLRFIPPALVLGRLGVDRTTRRAYLAANRDVRSAGTAAVLGRYVTDREFRSLVLRVAEARGAAPTWIYRFAWRSPVRGFAMHCIDVPFFFDCLAAQGVAAIAGSAAPQSLADAVHSGAVAFVATGDPGWPPFDESGTTRVFDDPVTVVEHGFEPVRALIHPAVRV